VTVALLLSGCNEVWNILEYLLGNNIGVKFRENPFSSSLVRTCGLM